MHNSVFPEGHTSSSISNLVKPPNLGSSPVGIAGGSDCVPVIETSLGEAVFSAAMLQESRFKIG